MQTAKQSIATDVDKVSLKECKVIAWGQFCVRWTLNHTGADQSLHTS